MRICVVAEHASTRFGGEAILPVHYFRLLRSRGIESWLCVHSRTQGEVAELFPNDLDRILFIPDLWIQKLLFSLSGYLPRRLSESTLGLFNQLITQFCQRRVVRQLVRDQQINVIHQPIPVAPRFPSALFGLGAPVVIGPLNGGMEYPPAFRGSESWMSRALLAFVRLFTDAVNTLLPGKKYASVVLVANERTRRALPSGIRGRVIELVENGIDVGLWQGAVGDQESVSPRFVFLGRLVDWKAVDVVIWALGKVPSAELEIIGAGPMLETWRSLASELGVKDRVHFTGWLTQEECAARLRASVALVLPSLYECGGAVVLEAMAMGKPVIATNWGGPADYLDASCGILVEPQNHSILVAGFAEAMQKMIDFPALRKSMGAAGRERAVRDFDWQRKVDQVISIYRALAENSEVPKEFEENRTSSATVSELN
ncbi:MAG: glycosyltransferase family 4 protein [Terracidiphilus sp.]|jgi:glycosyltransferase involved in cell wall biosynthesis